jgi:hypothetical protein
MAPRKHHLRRRAGLAGALVAAVALLAAPAAALAANSWTYSSQDGLQLDLQFTPDNNQPQPFALFTFTHDVQSFSCPNARTVLHPNNNMNQAECQFTTSTVSSTAHAVMAAVIACNDQIPYQAGSDPANPQTQSPLVSANNCSPPPPPPEQCPAGTPPLPHASPNLGQANDPNQRFIQAIYQDLLGRSADPAGATLLHNLLGNGATRTQVAQLLLGSSEYRSDLAGSIYQSYLRRAASSPENLAGVSALGAGTDEAFRASVLGSDEYFQKCAHGDNQSFVTHLYQDLLGRPADSAGMNTFLNLLGNGTPRSQVAQLLLGSGEYRSDLVRFDYQFFLRRLPSPGEITQLVNLLGNGGTDEQLIGLLLGSPEYLMTQAHVTPVLGRATLSGRGVLSLNVLLPAVQLRADVLTVLGNRPGPALRAAAVVPRTRRVGTVSFGRVRKGRRHIHWNLKVHGRKLRRGNYLVILRATDRHGRLLQQFDPLPLRVTR